LPADSTRGHRNPVWIFAAAAAACAVLAFGLFVWKPLSVQRPQISVEVGGGPQYKVGEKIPLGSLIRPSGNETMVRAWGAHSRIELRPQSELMLGSVPGGIRARLNGGEVILNASVQDGRFDLETQESVASATGAVFLVDSTPIGTRVAVIHGNVQIKQGN